MPVGRPTDYTKDLADRIVQARLDKPLRQVIRDDETLPCRSTVYVWLAKYPTFMDQYVHACEVDADNEFDELVELADKCEDPALVQIFKLKIDTRKWVLSKRLPDKYGDKIHNTHAGDQERPIQHNHTITPEEALKERGIPVPGVEVEDVE